MKKTRQPNFDNLLKVLNNEAPDKPTLFEMFFNVPLYAKLAGYGYIIKLAKWNIFKWIRKPDSIDKLSYNRIIIRDFVNGGYDYATVLGSDFYFPKVNKNMGKTKSINEGITITDRESFNSYSWPDPESFDYSMLDTLKKYLPDGMKL